MPGLKQRIKNMPTIPDWCKAKMFVQLDKTISGLKSKWDSPTNSVYQRGINAGITLAIQSLDSDEEKLKKWPKQCTRVI